MSEAAMTKASELKPMQRQTDFVSTRMLLSIAGTLLLAGGSMALTVLYNGQSRLEAKVDQALMQGASRAEVDKAQDRRIDVLENAILKLGDKMDTVNTTMQSLLSAIKK